MLAPHYLGCPSRLDRAPATESRAELHPLGDTLRAAAVTSDSDELTLSLVLTRDHSFLSALQRRGGRTLYLFTEQSSQKNVFFGIVEVQKKDNSELPPSLTGKSLTCVCSGWSRPPRLRSGGWPYGPATTPRLHSPTHGAHPQTWSPEPDWGSHSQQSCRSRKEPWGEGIIKISPKIIFNLFHWLNCFHIFNLFLFKLYLFTFCFYILFEFIWFQTTFLFYYFIYFILNLYLVWTFYS